MAGVEEGKVIASFPPRNVLHIPIKQSKMPWLVEGKNETALNTLAIFIIIVVVVVVGVSGGKE